MLQNIFHFIVGRRHYWRTVSFSEVGELYISRILRIIGVYVASGFASVYLYQLGYSLSTIAFLWVGYYTLKLPIGYFASKFVAYYGPKHGILISNFLYIPALLALSFIGDFGHTALAVWFVSLALSATTYQISYMVDFSKVKSLEHAGKEIGFMNIFERLAVAISPLVGGMIALIFGPQTIMLVGAFIFLLSAGPLFMTGERTHTHRSFSLRDFPFRANMSGLLTKYGMGVDIFSTATAWGLFIVIIVFPGFGNEIYLTLGALAAVTIVAAIISSYIYGRLIDRRRGGDLLRISAVSNGLVHALRPFMNTPLLVIVTNILNELSTAGVNMPYMRGIFDAADSSGNRVAYMFYSEMISDIGAGMAALFLGILVLMLGETSAFIAFFISISFVTSTVGFARFTIYRK